ncbi:MAG: hypothetical protein GDA53_03825 [Rhodobacteraceae bacterium]|nr:hypothetical protein [Paracoccaceae bacterium]
MYFLFHGFYKWAIITFVLCLLITGFVPAPFCACPAWRERAREKAERMTLPDRARRGG